MSTCNAFSISEGNAPWLLSSFMEKQAYSYITQAVGTINDVDTKKKNVVLWITIVQQLLERYASDRYLSEADNEIRHLIQRPGQSARDFRDVLMEKTKRMGSAYDTNDVVEIFTQNVRPAIRSAVQQRWYDETSKLMDEAGKRSRTSEGDCYQHTLIRMFDQLVSFADSLQDEEDSKLMKTSSQQQKRSNISSVNTTGNDLIPSTNTVSPVINSYGTSTSAAPPSSGGSSTGAYYNNNNKSVVKSDNYLNTNNGNQRKRDLPALPFGVLFRIPTGCMDIQRAVRRFLNEPSFCLCCGLSKFGQPSDPNLQPHNTSECPVGLPNHPVERYRVLAMRLMNNPYFQRAVESGMYPKITMAELPATPTPTATPSENDWSKNEQGGI